MKVIFASEPGVADKRYTVSGNEGVLFGAFDTQEEVVELVGGKPDNECTIRFGAGVGFMSLAANELAQKITALEKPWVCPICDGVGRVDHALPERCEIPGHSVGNECLAMRQLDIALKRL
jgi:hypothetical protein